MTDSPLRVVTTFPAKLLARVGETVPGVEVVHAPSEGELGPEVHGEVLVVPPWDPGNLEALLGRGVRWVHTIGTGVDRFPLELLGDRMLTCSRGASGVPIAEWVLAMMLAWTKDVPNVWLDAPPDKWNEGRLGGLYGHTLALLGLGGIGQATARHALSFGMRVRALRRAGAESPVPDVEVVRDLGSLLEGAHHLVLALPLTEATRHLIGREALARLPADAGLHIVNVSRGALIDHDALREALDDGRVARASLDVTEPEPLPEGHWLYGHPGVRISPHVSWNMPGAFDLLLDTFIENIRRHRAGEPLGGRVDLSQGY
jgi:phosphoglycerate dehydrogenase-like enzyme